MKRLFIALWLLLVLAALALALIPNVVKLQNGADKVLHVLVTCLLMLGPALFFRAKKYIIAFAVLMLCAGLGIELIQSLTPDRKPELLDILSNLIGTGLGLLIGYLLKSGYDAGRKAVPPSH